MPNYITANLRSKQGIQLDGTQYDSDSYVDGQWCRFYNGMPRKMAGYKALNYGQPEVVRNMFSVPVASSIDVYLGRASSIGYINVTFEGAASNRIDRTPTSGFTPNDNNQWSFDIFVDSTTSTSTSNIVAQVAQNVLDITSTIDGPIFYGDINTDTPLQQVVDTNNGNAPIMCSGGIVYADPILVAYGNNGDIMWSERNNINKWSVTVDSVVEPNLLSITNTKIIKGYRNRGAGNGSILFWTATSLISATYTLTAGEATFSSQTLADDITIISPNCIVQYNQQFFWIGIDQFYVFNGITQKLPNDMNADWFFNNLNYKYRSKVFGVVVPRYGEIHWHFPRRMPGVAEEDQPTECTDVIILNIFAKAWFNTELGRTAGIPSTTFPYPLLADSEPFNDGGVMKYPIWQHEKGLDKVIGQYTYPIESYFQSAYVDLFTNQPDINRMMRVRRVEPDFVIAGEMQVEVITRVFPHSPDVVTGPFTFDDTTVKIDDVNCQGRLVSCRFTSNCLGGYYQGGHILFDYNLGDLIP